MNDIRMYTIKCNMCKLCVGEYTGVQLIEFRFSSDVWKVHETDRATSEPADGEEYDKDSLYMTLFSSLHSCTSQVPSVNEAEVGLACETKILLPSLIACSIQAVGKWSKTRGGKGLGTRIDLL